MSSRTSSNVAFRDTSMEREKEEEPKPSLSAPRMATRRRTLLVLAMGRKPALAWAGSASLKVEGKEEV